MLPEHANVNERRFAGQLLDLHSQVLRLTGWLGAMKMSRVKDLPPSADPACHLIAIFTISLSE